MFNALNAFNFGLALTKCKLAPKLTENVARNFVTLLPRRETVAAPSPLMLQRKMSDACDEEDDHFNFVGKNVVYVGGFGAIGYATCQELVTKGIKSLFILDMKNDTDKLKKLQDINPNTAIGHLKFDLREGQCEIAKKIEDVHTCLGRIDCLINGANVLNDRDPNLTITVNLLGHIETTIAAYPFMSKAHCGHGGIICHIASALGLEPAGCIAIYTATKHGIVGFAKSISHPDYEKLTGIAHITVLPGATVGVSRTPILGNDTFENSKPLSEKMSKARSQSVTSCGINIVRAMEKGSNGSFFMVDLGKLTDVKVKNYWKIALKDSKK